MKKPVLVVMAAGMGSRYGGMKQIDPVGPNGQVIVDYSIYDAHRAGFDTVIFIIKHEIEDAFKAAIGDRLSRVMDVKYAFQQLEELPAGFSVPEGRVKPWGTCHAVLAAKDLIDGPFAVINADDYYGPEAFQVMYDYLSTHEDGAFYDYCMVSYLLQNTVSENGSVARGVCVTNPDGTLHSVTERTRIETYENGVHYTEDGGASWIDLPDRREQGKDPGLAQHRQVVWRHLPGGQAFGGAGHCPQDRRGSVPRRSVELNIEKTTAGRFRLAVVFCVTGCKAVRRLSFRRRFCGADGCAEI